MQFILNIGYTAKTSELHIIAMISTSSDNDTKTTIRKVSILNDFLAIANNVFGDCKLIH